MLPLKTVKLFLSPCVFWNAYKSKNPKIIHEPIESVQIVSDTAKRWCHKIYQNQNMRDGERKRWTKGILIPFFVSFFSLLKRNSMRSQCRIYFKTKENEFHWKEKYVANIERKYFVNRLVIRCAGAFSKRTNFNNKCCKQRQQRQHKTVHSNHVRVYCYTVGLSSV